MGARMQGRNDQVLVSVTANPVIQPLGQLGPWHVDRGFDHPGLRAMREDLLLKGPEIHPP
jgi:hypothetical protein